MTGLLPSIGNATDYERLRHAVTWEPVLQAIISRHGLPAVRPTRFADGMNPVFAVGQEYVIKLIPPFRASTARREIEALACLAAHPHVPVARLLAHGLIDNWPYLVTSRLEGEPLHRVWSGLDRVTQLRLATEYGQLLASLHAVPAGNLLPGGIVWSDFCRTAIGRWTGRRDFTRLSPQLQTDGPRFLARHASALDAPRQVLLHGDLAPENLLVRRHLDRWEIAGAIDFGNALRGAEWFDLTAASVLLQPGDRAIVHALCASGLADSGTTLAAIRPLLMAGTMIHPMGDLPECLGLIPGGETCLTWDEVALKFWPD